MTKTKYIVRATGGTWKHSFPTLEEAIEHAKTAWEFKDDPGTYIQEVITTTNRIEIGE